MSIRKAQDERIEGTPDGLTAVTEITDVPDAPIIGAATDFTTGGAVSVAFTPAATGGTASTYTATSSPGSITGTAASSPITVTGLTNGTSYTFTVRGSNSTGTSPASAASSPVTPTTFATGYMDALATVTVGASATNSIVFSAIPSTYAHLQIRVFSRDARSAALNNLHMRINGDTSANYTYHTVYGDGSTVIADGGTASTVTDYIYEPSASATASVFGMSIFDILDYTNTSKNKTIKIIGGFSTTGTSRLNLTSSLWLNTSAITSLTFFNSSNNNFAQYSSFTLYGIKG